MNIASHMMRQQCMLKTSDRGALFVAEVYALIRHWPGIAFFAVETMLRCPLDHPEDRDTSKLKAIICSDRPMYVVNCPPCAALILPCTGMQDVQAMAT